MLACEARKPHGRKKGFEMGKTTTRKREDKETEQAFTDMAEFVEKRCELIRAGLKATIPLPDRSKLDKPHNHKLFNQMALTSCLAEIICGQEEVDDALHAAIDMLEHYVLGAYATAEGEPPQVH
jgi:hypothetical protein